MSVADSLLAPADAVRSALYRLVAPAAAPLFADRSRRVAWLGAAVVGLSFAVTAAVPLWSLALGPILLGVPHLLADLRYLVVRPGLHRRRALWLAVPALLATSLGAGPVVGLLAVVPAVVGATSTWARRAPLLLAWAVLTALAWRFDFVFQLVFLHLHNLVAVGLWWWWRPRSARSALVLLAVLLGSAAILAGATEPVLTALHGWDAPWTGTSFGDLVDQTTPLADPTLALRLVLLFGFLQSVHYTVWLRLIPEDDRPRPAPRPFRASWAALRADFGLAPLLLVGALALGIAGWGLADLPGARLGYLSLASFHGYLELAAAAFFAAEARRP